MYQIIIKKKLSEHSTLIVKNVQTTNLALELFALSQDYQVQKRSTFSKYFFEIILQKIRNHFD
jgi:hypothetical protein